MRHQDRSNRLGFGGELADSQLQTTTSGLQQTKGTGIGILPAALMECASKQRTFIPHPNTPPTIKGESTNLANLSPPVGVRKEHLDAVQHPPDRNVNGSKSDLLTFRVTGAASVARFEPLLLGREWGGGHAIWSPPTSSASGQGASAIDFVWETTVTKCQRQQHRSARVLNRLVGAQVLEDKANLALLQRLMSAPTLESRIMVGRKEVYGWAHLQFLPLPASPDHSRPPLPSTTDESSDTEVSPSGLVSEPGSPPIACSGNVKGPVGENWWCVKASGGNGGMDIWVMHEGNWREVAKRLHDSEEYVIQRYVVRPLLWRGRKFHFRCYAAISADMSAWLYRSAYILCASRPYTLDGSRDKDVEDREQDAGLTDDFVHISNLAVNKHTEGHPGQVPCELPHEYPKLWPRMLELLRSLVEAATPFMQHQTASGHFEFLGLDLIADAAGGVWLMEVNRLPGLQSSKQNLEEENRFYDTMMVDLIRLLVLPSLLGCSPNPGMFEAAARAAPSAKTPSTETWRNVMRFAAFKRACKRRPPLA